jgi:glycosyltransferase involved in cell wall biosynthesis
MKPLTVLFNTWPAAFDCPGGGEIQLLKYEEHLQAAGVHILRYNMWSPRPQFDMADAVHFFSVQGGIWRFPDYVHKMRKVPLVISPIVWIDKPDKYNLSEIGHLLRMADRILPNSQAECAQLSELFSISAKKFTPIVNGVDECFFETITPALFRETFNLYNPFVLCMGNIEERKNQLRLIKALAGTGIHLVLAGQEREADYAAQCHADADETVLFIGNLEHGSSLHRSAYVAAELLCLPSTLETPGLAALEAAAAGTRLALTQVGCTKEYFGNYAVYCDPENIESIRSTVMAAFAKMQPTSLPHYIRENYTWRRAAEQLIRVYQNILYE